MKNFRDFKKKTLKNKEIKRAYEELKPEFEIIKLLIRKRLENGLTQAELARKIGTKQSAIARLESGKYNPTLSFLNKVARALDAEIKVKLK